MPTLTASSAARAAANARGLDLPTEPESPKPTKSIDPQKVARSADRREQQQQARDKLWPLLSEVFPAVFRLPPVPMAIGVHCEILDIAGDSIDPDELAAFLHYWTTRQTYRFAVWRGEARRNLDGSPAGAPTIEQRNQAGRQLWGEQYQPIVAPQPGVDLAAAAD